MPLFTLLFYVVVVVCLVAAAIWVIDYLAPDHPKVIDKGLWVLCVVIVLYMILAATGLLNSGPMVPRLGGR